MKCGFVYSFNRNQSNPKKNDMMIFMKRETKYTYIPILYRNRKNVTAQNTFSLPFILPQSSVSLKIIFFLSVRIITLRKTLHQLYSLELHENSISNYSIHSNNDPTSIILVSFSLLSRNEYLNIGQTVRFR